jgi:spore coat protein H
MKNTTIILSFVLISMFSSPLFAQNPGDNFFNYGAVHDIYITFNEPNWYDTLQQYKWLDDNLDSTVYLLGNVNIDGTIIDSIGIRFKGNSSYYNYTSDKKPFKLDFNEFVSGRKFDGLKKLNLNNMYQDPTFMREKLFLDFINQHGLYGPRSAYSRVFVNGTYWGLYLALDQIDKTFIDRVFGNDTENLFKGDGPGASCANLEYHGQLSSYYNCYELKTNETANNWNDLINLTAQINNTSSVEFRDSVESVMNTNSFIGAWACYNLFCNFDSYPYRFSHNYYTYHNSSSNKFEWIVWDASTAFGNDIPWTISTIENVSIYYIWPQETDRPLTYRMLLDTVYRQVYTDFMCQYIQDFTPSMQNVRIDSLYNIIQPDVYTDTKKIYSNTQFDNNINTNININGTDYPGLKSFIANRYLSVQNELASESCTPLSIIEESMQPINFQLYPNPTNGDLNIVFDGVVGSELDIKISNPRGQIVYNKRYSLFKKKSEALFSTSDLPSGIYFVSLHDNVGNHITKKFVIKK